MTTNSNVSKDGMKKVTPAELLTRIYMYQLELDLKLDLLSRKVESLQEDVSRSVFVRSENIRIRFDHKTGELYITEFFKIQFEGNEATLLGAMFKKSNGRPKKSTKFYPAELAGMFQDETEGLKTPKAVQGTIARVDTAIKQRTMGLEVFKITSKVFYFL